MFDLQLDIDKLIHELGTQSWSCMDNLLPVSTCQKLHQILKQKKTQDDFKKAEIGRGQMQHTESEIRESEIFWIENWKESRELEIISGLYLDLMGILNQAFFLSMKRFESQFAIYPPNGFYKKHLDQHRHTRHRQVTCILYLNDCHDGGELVVFNKDDKKKIDTTIIPSTGTLVIFFSAHVYHEVKKTKQERYSLTTWMRDDNSFNFDFNPM